MGWGRSSRSSLCVTLVEGTEARSLLGGVCVERGYPSDYRYLLLLLTCTIMLLFSLCV